MPSLTPEHRAEETSAAAFQDGIMSGALALIPSGACLSLAMRNPRFVRSTNWQSRTALVVMPALFAFAITSESKLQHRMQEMAAEADHARATSEWAKGRSEGSEAATTSGKDAGARITRAMTKEETEKQLTEMYRKGVEESGMRIVPGNTLSLHHRMSNFLMENPFKVLAGVGIPTVLYIFKGRSQKDHLQLQMKLMHTRVFGQFAVISLLLSLMGFKEYMDRNGRFITEYEAQRKVEEMHNMQQRLMDRLERDRAFMEKRDRVLRKAHKRDLKRLGHPEKGEEDLAKYGVLEDDLSEEEAEEIVKDPDGGDPAMSNGSMMSAADEKKVSSIESAKDTVTVSSLRDVEAS